MWERGRCSLTCPSSMSPLWTPRGLSSVLLVRRIDKLWALRFCLGWRAAEAEPLLLPPSTGIPPTCWVALPPPCTRSYLRSRWTKAKPPPPPPPPLLLPPTPLAGCWVGSHDLPAGKKGSHVQVQVLHVKTDVTLKPVDLCSCLVQCWSDTWCPETTAAQTPSRNPAI